MVLAVQYILYSFTYLLSRIQEEGWNSIGAPSLGASTVLRTCRCGSLLIREYVGRFCTSEITSLDYHPVAVRERVLRRPGIWSRRRDIAPGGYGVKSQSGHPYIWWFQRRYSLDLFLQSPSTARVLASWSTSWVSYIIHVFRWAA